MNALQRDLKALTAMVEKEYAEKVKSDPWRLDFHLMPPVGWLNDPNGLCWIDGEYHVFFQYAPFNPAGGVKFWGHYKSSDLINWEYTGVPLLPDQPFDCHGVYSGSAFVDDGKLELFYTGSVKLAGDYDYVTNGRESSTLYVEYKDGQGGIKKKLMTNSDYPEGLSCHVRDPKVWKEDELYYMVLGARDLNDVGKVLLYSSEDKKSWKFCHMLESRQPFGYMWECPDLFALGGNNILSVSPQGVPESGGCYQNLYQSGYYQIYGDYKSQYTLSEFQEWDKGFDFYAPQTFLDEKQRRILIAWMGMPDCEDDYTNPTIERGWNHALTIPRVLTWKDGKILQNPAEEFKQLRKQQQDIKGGSVISELNRFELELDNPSSEDVTVTIADGLMLEYEKENGLFTIKFLNEQIGCGRKQRTASLDSCVGIRVLVDSSCMEVFLNGGETVFTTRFYPETEINCKISGTGCTGTLWKL